MIRFLSCNDPEFEQILAQIVARGEEVSAEVESAVKAIIAEVRARGDAAVCDYTAQFDRLQLTAATMEVTAAEIDAAMARVGARELADLQLAADRIATFHAQHKTETWLSSDENDGGGGLRNRFLGSERPLVEGGRNFENGSNLIGGDRDGSPVATVQTRATEGSDWGGHGGGGKSWKRIGGKQKLKEGESDWVKQRK